MEKNKLKLNYKNTFIIGLAFFAILMLWQVYNTYCPLILRELLNSKFEDANKLTYVIGIIMALDNVAALILMPIFGGISDKTKSKFGKRMPYIIIGMAASAIVFPIIAVFYIYNSLVGVIVTMGFTLTIMQCYRSPAVALMPDLTPKPLRSTANGIINLVGYIGAILAGVLAMIFKKKSDGDLLTTAYLWPFIISSVCMILCMIILIVKIKENKLIEETKEDIERGEEESQSLDDVRQDKLSKRDFINLIFILIAVFAWFMSFNAVETFNSLFCQEIIGDSGIHGTFTIILTVSSLITFIIFSGLSARIGRKWTIVIGLGLLIAGFSAIAIACFIANLSVIKLVIYISTVFVGIGWGLVNINSYPMIVEMSNKNNVGKFTGRYYMASMIAQIVTPVVLGLIMSFNTNGLRLLYVYAAITMAISLAVFIFAKERRDLKKKEKDTRNILEKIGDVDD